MPFVIPRVSWIVIGVLAILLAVQTVRIEGLKVWPLSIAGLKAERDGLLEKLRDISDKRDEQKQTTEGKLVETRIIYRDANRQAERIEKAPTAPDCKTPEAIMGADI